ncbi:MAG TPA: hypothetical protein RMH99_29530 [Sandaracinaceae bacterium LLY-WYZ-13_1]|nr:hypothetical protein [Sandaracinaceae bacterium LLY-WYZ-13_1]
MACVVLAAGLFGCEPRRVLGDQCELSTGCAAPLVCRLSRCRRFCASARDCPFGSRCVLDQAGLGSCLLAEEDACDRDGDCPSPLVCIDDRCTNACEGDRDCATGASCVEGACIEAEGRACRASADCEGDTLCVAGRCRAECAAERDCREGARCVDGACVPLPVERMDAGGFDAGRDAASLDAGVDAGPVDAGTDAGPVFCEGEAGVCPAVHMASTACRSATGECAIESCSGAFLDCDGAYRNGCEVSPDSNRAHCGGCGMPCDDGEACLAGACVPATIEQVEVSGVVCVRWSTGQVSCWGRNEHGQVGNGASGDPVLVPSLVPGISDATDLCVGASDGHFVCARHATGAVSCWGRNYYGEIGDGGTTGRVMGMAVPVVSPTAVAGLSDAVEVECGDAFACARRSTGEVACWGHAERGRLGFGTAFRIESASPLAVATIDDAAALDVGEQTSCVLRASGEVWCWGRGDRGQLGDGLTDSGHEARVPVRVDGLDAVTVVEVEMTQRGQGYAVTDDGRTFCWGSNLGFACGVLDPTARHVLAPAEVAGLRDLSSLDGSAAIDATGAHWAWSYNDVGQLGLGVWANPVMPPERSGIDDAVDVSMNDTGFSTQCIVREGGRVRCAGHNQYGQLGNVDTRDRLRNRFAPVEGLP